MTQSGRCPEIIGGQRRRLLSDLPRVAQVWLEEDEGTLIFALSAIHG